MSLVDSGNGNMYMPVAPAYGGNGFGNGFCGDGWWIILFLFAMFGNGGWGGFGGGNNGVMPYLWNDNTQNEVARGFDNAAVTNQLNGIQNAITNGFASAELAGCNRAMDTMNQNFTLQSQMANCCCENRLAIANLASDIARENCADRQAVADGIQRIITQMCDDKIDAKNEKIAELQNQLNIANIIAAGNANTSRLLADNAAQTVALEQYLNPTAIPAYIVQNPNCCSAYSPCGSNQFYN